MGQSSVSACLRQRLLSGRLCKRRPITICAYLEVPSSMCTDARVVLGRAAHQRSYGGSRLNVIIPCRERPRWSFTKRQQSKWNTHLWQPTPRRQLRCLITPTHQSTMRGLRSRRWYVMRPLAAHTQRSRQLAIGPIVSYLSDGRASFPTVSALANAAPMPVRALVPANETLAILSGAFSP